MSVQSSPINQRFVILLQCLSEVLSEVHCFFAQNPASFMNDYLVTKPVYLHTYLYQIQILVQFVIVNMDQEMYLPYFEKKTLIMMSAFEL